MYNPEILKIQAAFAQVLDLSGAIDNIEKVERDLEKSGAVLPGDASRFCLASHIQINSHGISNTTV